MVFSWFRIRLQRAKGVRFVEPSTVLINEDAYLDDLNPEGITTCRYVLITLGVTIRTHYLDTTTKDRHFVAGKVVIDDDVFIGLNVFIVKPVTVGRGAIVFAGTVVTKDIPPFSILGGVPAKVIGTKSTIAPDSL